MGRGTRLMAVIIIIMAILPAGNLIKVNIITKMDGTQDLQVNLVAGIFIMAHGIQLMEIRILVADILQDGNLTKVNIITN